MRKVFLILFLLPVIASAQKVISNLPSNLVLKNITCSPYEKRILDLDVINRGDTVFRGGLRLQVIDADGDIVWQGVPSQLAVLNGSPQLVIDAKNGQAVRFYMQAGSCHSATLGVS